MKFLKTKEQVIDAISFFVILFWAMWFTVVFITDFTDFLQVIHILPQSFAFSSKNYNLIIQSLAPFHLNVKGLDLIIFVTIIIVAGLTGLFFWYGVFNCFRRDKESYLYYSYLAFFVSITMTEFFIICDEIFVEYEFSHNHVVRLAFQFITLILFYLFTHRKV